MAKTATYALIDSATASGSQSSITFTNIPQTYTDLVLVSGFNGVSSNNFSTRVGNGSIDTGANYSYTRLWGTGSGGGSASRNANESFLTANITVGSSGSNSIIQIMDYANTTTFKTALHRFNDAGAIVFAIVGLWRSTSAINQLRVYSTNSVNFASGSTFKLYGIQAGNA